ncbi:MAG: hypothetical protein ACRDSR_24755 [Pseudonocardiaceae bacterium]
MTDVQPPTLNKEIRAALGRQQIHALDPGKINPILLPPCTLRILIVLDLEGTGFGEGDFSLGTLLGALAVPPGPWVSFEVTKAHRRASPDADIANFSFDTHDLSQYDQMWLFGVERTGSEISEPELRAISQFMDGGGGVFAAGDHEDLGVAMCGAVPRVRSMRKWHWPNPGPNGEPVAPSIGGPDRHDTLSEGHDPGVTLDDQSDDIPQRITPRLYSSLPWNKFFFSSHPHPLLCGPRGVIRVLPDHPHEGECYEPADLTATFTFDGYQVTEYPGGIAPEVIAYSTIVGRTINDVKGPLNPRKFGAIGAYDGHRAAVGRVAVDATWHHFFNINLIGELGNPNPLKSLGFLATPAGQAVLAEIKAYYQNIAVWLARPSSQACMAWRALWWVRWNHALAMDLRPHFQESVGALELGELIRVGSAARKVLGRVTGECDVIRWIGWEIIRPLCPEIWARLGQWLDPWYPGQEVAEIAPGSEPFPDITLPTYADMLFDAVLGGLIYGIATEFPRADDDARGRAEQVQWPDIVDQHLTRCVELVAEQVRNSAEQVRDLAQGLTR